MFRYQTDRFMPEFCCILTSLWILHRTPPDLYLSTLVKVSVFIKPHHTMESEMLSWHASRSVQVSERRRAKI